MPPGDRLAKLAKLVGEMHSEPPHFLPPPPSVRPQVRLMLSCEEEERMRAVYPEASRRFRSLLRQYSLNTQDKLPSGLREQIALEGAAKAVRRAKTGPTAAYVYRAMKWELLWHLRNTPEACAIRLDAPRGKDEDGKEKPHPWERDPALWTEPIQLDRLEQEEEEEADEEEQRPDEINSDIFHRQPSLTKRRILYARSAQSASAKRLASLLRHRNRKRYTTREVNRILNQTRDDIKYTRSTGKFRDKELRNALDRLVLDARHREALFLYLTRGMSTRQLGEKYGVSHVAIYKWITRAKHRLIAHVRQHGPPELLASLMEPPEAR
jgi:predicted DNA-binding protein (UPF0251 family)